MNPLADLHQLIQPEVAAAGLGLLLLIWWAVRRRRQRAQRLTPADADRFSQRRSRPSDVTPLSPSVTATSTQPALTPSNSPPAGGPAREADTVSGSRWMQSRIPTGDASEVSDSELAVWGPTAIMSALDEAAAAPRSESPDSRPGG